MSGKAELFAAIQWDFRLEELSIRALADRHGVHRRTVRAALASAVPAPRNEPSPVQWRAGSPAAVASGSCFRELI